MLDLLTNVVITADQEGGRVPYYVFGMLAREEHSKQYFFMICFNQSISY
jgi:hypothetical protein